MINRIRIIFDDGIEKELILSRPFAKEHFDKINLEGGPINIEGKHIFTKINTSRILVMQGVDEEYEG